MTRTEIVNLCIRNGRFAASDEQVAHQIDFSLRSALMLNTLRLEQARLPQKFRCINAKLFSFAKNIFLSFLHHFANHKSHEHSTSDLSLIGIAFYDFICSWFNVVAQLLTLNNHVSGCEAVRIVSQWESSRWEREQGHRLLVIIFFIEWRFEALSAELPELHGSV